MRASGILMHISSLPSPYGIGTMGREARAFADFRVNCEIAREIGAEKMVLHLWNGKPSDTRIENHLAAYGRLKEEDLRRQEDLNSTYQSMRYLSHDTRKFMQTAQQLILSGKAEEGARQQG